MGAPPDQDMTNECLSDSLHQGATGMQVQDLREVLCSRCRNTSCIQAKYGDTLFDKRVRTNVDRLLVNPQFSDLSSAEHKAINANKFGDLSSKARKIIISTLRNDWKPVSDAEIGIFPDNSSQASPETARQVDVAVEKLAKMTGKKLRPGVEVLVAPETPEVMSLEAVEVSETQVSPPKEMPVIDTSKLPPQRNTSMPPAGIMIDGSEPTRRDSNQKPATESNPWALKPKVTKVSPGATFDFGKK